MVTLYIARNNDGEVWLFNQEPELADGVWGISGGEYLYLGTDVHVYLDLGECKEISGIDIQVD